MSDENVPKFARGQYEGFDKSGATQVGTGVIPQAWLGPSKTTSSAFNTAYPTFTPAWASTGTAPAIGNGVVGAGYKQVGKFVHYYGRITFGSTSTFGSGNYTFTLPTTASAAAIAAQICGSAFIFDSSASAFATPVPIIQAGGASFSLSYAATYLGTVTVIGVTAPWTWATSDQIAWSILYEAA